jgi:hypothetical protein
LLRSCLATAWHPMTASRRTRSEQISSAPLRAFALVDREMFVDERDASITTAAVRFHRLVQEIAATAPTRPSSTSIEASENST